MLPTYQAVVFAIINPIVTLLPIDRSSHFYLFERILQWHLTESVNGLALLCISISLFIYFIHDWASLLSSALRMIFTFQSPKSIDERIFFFIFISQIPIFLFFFYGQLLIPIYDPIMLISSLLFFNFLLYFSDRMNRKRKTYLDWSLSDSIIFGLSQLTAFIPGGDRQIGALTGGFLRNYTYEALLKFTCLSFTPWLFFMGVYSIGNFQSIALTFQMELWTFILFILCSLVSSFFTISYFIKLYFRQSIKGFIFYRTLCAAVIAGFYFF